MELSDAPQHAGTADATRPTQAVVRRVDFGGIALLAGDGFQFEAIARKLEPVPVPVPVEAPQ